jgi:cell division protein FtsQ
MHLLISKKKIYLYLFILIFLSTSLNINFTKGINNVFNLKKIEIIGLNYQEKKKINENLNILKDQNILFITRAQLINIFKQYNEIENYKVQKVLPSKLNIEIKKTKVIAKTINNGKVYLIGENEKLIRLDNLNKNLNLPFVFGDFPIKEFVSLQDNLKKINFNLNKIYKYFYFKSGRWDLKLEKDITLKLPIKKQFETLQKFSFLERENKVKPGCIIDLRIAKKIIITNGR